LGIETLVGEEGGEKDLTEDRDGHKIEEKNDKDVTEGCSGGQEGIHYIA